MKTKNKTYMLSYLQKTCLKILTEKSTYKILPVFFTKIYVQIYYQTWFDQLHVQQHILTPDLQPAKKLIDLFIDNNRNGCTIISESSQTLPLRDKRDKTENCGTCEVLQKRWTQVFSFWRN